MGHFLALSGRIYPRSCLVKSGGYFPLVHFGSAIATALHPPQRNLALGPRSAPTSHRRQHFGGSGWLAACFESWDTSGKTLAGSILAMSWEIPWLLACRWYRNKASVPLWWGLCWRQRGDPSISLEVPGSGEMKPNPTSSLQCQENCRLLFPVLSTSCP